MQKATYSMKWKVIRILLICWLIPFLFLIGVMGIYFMTRHSDMTADNFQTQIEFDSRICVERLDRAVNDSRQASYDGEILQTRKQYLQGKLSFDAAQKKYGDYLSQKYRNNAAVSSVILWFVSPEEEADAKAAEAGSSSIYSEKQGGSYQQIRNYWEKDHRDIAAMAAKLDTAVGFFTQNDSLYLVRNLVDSHFQIQGVLIFNLNQLYCFNSLLQFPLQEEICVWINDGSPLLCPEDEKENWISRLEQMKEKKHEWRAGRLYLSDHQKGEGYQIHSGMKIQKEVTRFPFYGYPWVILGMILSLGLMLILVLFVFRSEVTDPVRRLSEGLEHIEKGELGYQIAEVPPSLEFKYLTDSVNEMSTHLQQQFQRLYEEEIALREARIKALQSHINPHFLNNTMEIINWEARLEGNLKVSKMIEALSTMMDAAMDRRKRPEVRLAEEMGYVNSYLYIMKERLGKRLTVEIDIPEDLMDALVPRLILQPVIENAIEHGVVPNGSGTVFVKGTKENGFLYLDILNDGGMSEADQKRINELLNQDQSFPVGTVSGNIGIANVNQRLRILFGVPCGLSITSDQEGKVTARLTIPYHI